MWAAGVIAEQSGGVYQLDLGRVRFDWPLRRVTVEAIGLTTRRAVNRRRPQPLPGLRLALSQCTISGVQFVTLIRRAGLIASRFGCRSGSLVVEVPRGVPTGGLGAPSTAPAEHATGERQTFLAFQQGVRPPSYAPRVRIARVVFQRLALEVRLPRTTGGATRLQLERLQWSMADLAIDPADTTAAARPLFSRMVELVATNFTTHPEPATAVHVGRLRTSLTDSSLEIRGVGFAPSVSSAEFTRLRGHRSDLIRLTVGRLTAQGIDFGAFLLGEGVHARRIEVDSFRIDVTSDRRVPKGPPGPPHRTPQQWIADLDETFSLDSLLVRNGTVVYREHASGRARAGVLTLARIEATAANVSHVVGRRTSGDSMTLTARARLLGAGLLDLRAVVPLDAPRFDMTLHGTLGAMPALALNAFVLETGTLQVESGRVAGVSFRVAVRNGVATGAVTPRFNDLSVSVIRGGSHGILGGGGILGGAARGIASLMVKQKVRADNPDRPENAPLVGTIRRTFTTDKTLISFLWVSLRDGLLLVVKR